MIRVVVHVLNEDPFVAELEGLPDPRDQYVVLRNPRRRDGKRLSTLTDGVTTILFPWHRVTFIELLDDPSGRAERLLTIFRDEPGSEG
ncbi:MAG: hypothetical protein RMK01_02890 [Thermomicrobium sp.]|nr:hypothetical protein [Thermomicrobium sp.]MDW8058999.1 hypothetical protein [Thermomicrobium sp.]